MTRPRVLIADDHRLVAEGVSALLASEFDVVGIVEDGRALLAAAESLSPEVIVADISMPSMNGLEALSRLVGTVQAKIVILTMHRDVAYARRAFDLGASGYVLKHAASEELVHAIRATLVGKKYLSPEMADDVLQSLGPTPQGRRDPTALLSARQREILQLLAEGKTAKEIAALLGISARTVETHKYTLMRTAGIKTSAELVHFAIKHGIVEV